MNEIIIDCLVVGAGIAGSRAAIEVAKNDRTVLIVSSVPLKKAHSVCAMGGMQAALANSVMSSEDNVMTHFSDTVKGSDWGADQDVAELFCRNAPSAVRELSDWGVPWNRITAGKKVLSDGRVVFEKKENEGLITSRNFGGTANWRTCYSSDSTGHSILFAVNSEAVRLKIPVLDRIVILSLVLDGNRCKGAVAADLRTGSLVKIIAKTVIIAAGGAGQLYSVSTNSASCNGSGTAMVLNTGLGVLGNMESVQFHPTTLFPSGILISEACRGDGGYLRDKNNHRFMNDYEPTAGDLASRDVVARRIMQHISSGHGVQKGKNSYVFLDIRHLGEKHIKAYLREVHTICNDLIGINPVKELIPVRPAQHYTMGGIRTDKDCSCEKYGISGLFSAGESACWDLHGFNRLGGNSLGETIVAGTIAGRSAAEYISNNKFVINHALYDEECSKVSWKIEKMRNRNDGENVFEIRRKITDLMMDHVGIFRNEGGLNFALMELQKLYRKSKYAAVSSVSSRVNKEVVAAFELKGFAKLAICAAKGALLRTESRGSHYRDDYSARDDENFMKRSLFRWKDDEHDEPSVEYEDVVVTSMPPAKRGYGENE